MIEGLQNTMKADSAKTTKVDCTAAVEEYINKADWRIKANANTGYSNAGLVNNLSGKMIANFWLDKVYSKIEGDAHRNGDYHIHDLDSASGYCCGHDLQRLLNEGFNGVKSRTSSKPPKHFREALYQMANFIGILQSEWAGAQAFASYSTFLAPYVFFDKYFSNVNDSDFKQATVNFIYNLNVPSRWGQSPFSNITIDLIVPKDLKMSLPQRGNVPFFKSIFEEWKAYKKEKFGKEYTQNWINFIAELIHRIEPDKSEDKCWNDAINALGIKQSIPNEIYKAAGITPNENLIEIDPEKCDLEDIFLSATYGLFQPELDIINTCYYEAMNEGDAEGQPFTFPIPTVNVDNNFDWDSPVSNLIFENAAKYGSSYFQNFIGSQYRKNPETGEKEIDPNAYKPDDVRSMCPLTFDTGVVVRSSSGITIEKIGEMYHSQINNGTTYEVFNNGKWYKCEVICVGEQSTYTIKTSNNNSIELGKHHLQLIYRNNKEITVEAKDIKIGDMIPWNINPIGDIKEANINLEDKNNLDLINGKAYYSVTDIKFNVIPKILYCVEITDDNSDKLFVLGNGMITHNCRLQLDKRELRKKGGGLFGADAQTGSVGVVTINMARLGYTCVGDKKMLYKKLDRLMDLAKSTLEKKRAFVEEMMKRGLYPYTKRYVRTLDTFFSTIGINGMNEMIRNFTNDQYNIADDYGQNFAKEIMEHIRKKLKEYQAETGTLYNLEATPAEGTTYRLAREDQKRFPEHDEYYINCDIHGHVKVDATEGEVECPLCKKEEESK